MSSPPGSPLHGRHVVLGVSGGVAAYKAVELARLLVKAGAVVEAVLTPEAAKFVTPLTFTAVTGRQASTELFGGDDPIPHTRLGQAADLVVVAPTTAHLMGRFAGGLADDLLTNVLLATRAPVLLALAMHTEMWEQPSVQRNVATLRADGVFVIDPEKGQLAGGDVGVGRLAEPETILARCEEILGGPGYRSDLAGLGVLVSAGGTREPIDPVRYIGNRSSGKMGHAIAAEAVARGARVVLVTSSHIPVPDAVHETVHAETAADMASAILSRYDDVDAVIMAAAVADFRPESAAGTKIKKRDGPPRIELTPTLDILTELGTRKEGQFLVGFAAETDDVTANGAEKVARKNLDLLVANVVGVEDSGFGTETNRAWFCMPGGRTEDLGLMDKGELAGRICDRIADSLAGGDR